VIYGANFVRIEIDATSFALLGDGPVQEPVAAALDALGANPGMSAAIGGLQMLDPSQIPAALEALNPTRANAQAVAGFTIGDVLREQLGRRSYDLLGGSAGGNMAQLGMGAKLASSDPTAEMLASMALAAADSEDTPSSDVKLPNGYGLYFAGDAAWTKTDQPGGIGVDDADIQALTGGLDYNDAKGSVFGAALSYLKADIEQNYGFGGDTQGDGVALSAFGASRMGGLSVDLYGVLGWVNYDTTRRLLVAPATFATATGTTDSVQAQAGANFAAELADCGWATLSGVGGLHYISLSIDGYAETGAGALSALLPDRDIESLKSLLGAQVALHVSASDSVVPYLRAMWGHEFSEDGLATSAAFAGGPAVSFTSPGPDLGDDWATLGAGFSGRLSPRMNVYLRYQGDFGRESQDSHTVSAAARYAF
jgi:outer membrane autotransporter protein